MINKVQDGSVMVYSNSGSAISSGDPVVIGDRVGFAIVDIAASTGSGSVAMEGVFSCEKTTSQAWSQGDKLFYDSGTGKFTNVATGKVPAGYAFENALSADTSGVIKLFPQAKQSALQADTVAADLAALKVDFNALLAKLKDSGQMSNS